MLSSQGRAVLQALAAAVDGRLETADVRRRVQRPGTAATVARASLSRTLRRLWIAGLVELADSDRQTLTGEADRLQHLADVVAAQPESSYRAYLDRVRRNGQRDRYGSAARYAAAWQETAQRVPHLRAQQVQLTTSGREAVNSATECHPNVTRCQTEKR